MSVLTLLVGLDQAGFMTHYVSTEAYFCIDILEPLDFQTGACLLEIFKSTEGWFCQKIVVILLSFDNFVEEVAI